MEIIYHITPPDAHFQDKMNQQEEQEWWAEEPQQLLKESRFFLHRRPTSVTLRVQR
jgi:hypothetical protein